MKEICSQVDIAATPEKVWAILTDFSGWKEWNPIAEEASGRAEVGTELFLSFGGPGCKTPHSFKPTVLEARLSAGENPVSRFTGSEEPYRR